VAASAVAEERASFYAADGTLRTVDRRTGSRRWFERYRYDPLGRRIWVWSDVQCAPLNALECHTGRLRRTVWDGAQELGEIQVPLDSTSYWERDTGAYPVGYELQSGTSATGDPNPLYGQVLYGPGLAVDQPLSVTRFNYTDKPSASAPATTWPTVTLLPGWDVRGVPVFGLFSGTLAGARAYQAGPTQASCPGLATTTPDRCLRVQWPAGQSAYDQQRGRTERLVWHGTVLEGKREGTGLEYKRHRYYDPTTGRFTQPDPIGLAGGLNLYGFADGDPVNFSDPFGLCPVCVIYAAYEVGSTLFDLYDLAKTGVSYARGQASKTELGVTAAGTLAGLFSVGGGLGKAGRSGVRILEREGNTVIGTFNVAKGEARFAGELVEQGETLVVRGAHIEGAGTLAELKSVAREFGREHGFKRVVIEGGRRTTGARPGHIPRPITIDIP